LARYSSNSPAFPVETKELSMRTLYLLAAASAVGAMAVPAAAQSSYPYQSYPVQQANPYAQPVPQPYPGQPGYGYAQPGYAQPYGSANPVEQIINQLLGNNSAYTVSDRTQVSRCATAAVAQAQRQYRPASYGGYAQPYGQAYGYGQQYDHRYANNAWSQMRVTAITNVERRRYNSLRVTGLISSGMYAQPYGNAYGYQGQRYNDPRYAQAADLSFRCSVDSRGAVSGVRISRNAAAYRR
jgi:hypothetical protein